MALLNLFGLPTSNNEGLFEGHLGPLIIAWSAIAILCYVGAVPLSSGRLEKRESIVEITPRNPTWLRRVPCLYATLMLLFHLSLFTIRRNNSWTLPLIAIIIYINRHSYRYLDSELVDFVQLRSEWHHKADPRDVKQTAWLAAAGISAIIGLSAGVSPSELACGLLTIALGLALFVHLPEFVSNHETVDYRTFQRQHLLPITLQVIAGLVILWIMLGAEPFSLPSAVLFSILPTIHILAIMISIKDGTALPVLAAVSASSILQGFTDCYWESLLLLVPYLGLSLTQFLLALPAVAAKRRILWLYVVRPLLAVTAIRILVINYATPTAETTLQHPVQILHQTNLALFERRLASQSQTSGDAVAEYQRRYGRMPPPKFEDWFELAKANNFQFVDEFDSIMLSLAPFLDLPSTTLQQLINNTPRADGIMMISVRNSLATYGTDEHSHGDLMTEVINRYNDSKLLPDFDFLVNIYDEPRVSVPFEATAQVSRQASSVTTSDQTDSQIKFLDLCKKDPKKELQRACPSTFQNGSSRRAEKPTFVNDVTVATDFCQNPELFDQCGFLTCPDTLFLTHTLVPLLSQSRPTHFHDILYPSPEYIDPLSIHGTVEPPSKEEDLDWELKSDSLYWSGSSTGGHSSPDNWKSLHRQRLALMATIDASITPANLLAQDEKTGRWQSYDSTWSRVSKYLHVRLNRIVQCEEEACNDMKAAFPFASGAEDPVRASMAGKYAFDMDGNTFSGRFYRLLRSKTCVLKTTLFKEWHDDFLVPWVHYIPVSASYEELPELIRFLIEEEEGQILGKKIADMSRDWASNVLRQVDIELVNLRLFMEVARMLGVSDGPIAQHTKQENNDNAADAEVNSDHEGGDNGK